MYYVYNWYHHMMPTKERKKIEQCFKDHDYFTFIELYKQYNARGLLNGFYSEEFECFCPIIYFPGDITVYMSEDAEKPFDYISVLDKENFLKINYQECECG